MGGGYLFLIRPHPFIPSPFKERACFWPAGTVSPWSINRSAPALQEEGGQGVRVCRQLMPSMLTTWCGIREVFRKHTHVFSGMGWALISVKKYNHFHSPCQVKSENDYTNCVVSPLLPSPWRKNASFCRNIQVGQGVRVCRQLTTMPTFWRHVVTVWRHVTTTCMILYRRGA